MSQVRVLVREQDIRPDEPPNGSSGRSFLSRVVQRTMMLFDDLPLAARTDSAPPTVLTPLGKIELDVASAAEKAVVRPADETRQLACGGAWRCWDGPAFRAELALAPFEARVPPGQKIDAAWAAIWRLHAKRPLPTMRFGCTWKASASWTTNEGSASGQYLESQAWNDGQNKVAIGTEDGEALAERGRVGDWFPQRIARNESWPEQPAIHSKDGYVERAELAVYKNDGLDVMLPSLLPGERFQCQFLLAWAPLSSEEIATWFAIERFPTDILLSWCEGAAAKSP